VVVLFCELETVVLALSDEDKLQAETVTFRANMYPPGMITDEVIDCDP